MYFLRAPARNDLPAYEIRVPLSGAIYTLRLYYNTRSSRWHLDIADSSNNNVLVGLPVLVNRDVTGQYVTIGIPPGVFFASDDTNGGNEATRYSFGTDHTLWYGDPTLPDPTT